MHHGRGAGSTPSRGFEDGLRRNGSSRHTRRHETTPPLRKGFGGAGREAATGCQTWRIALVTSLSLKSSGHQTGKARLNFPAVGDYWIVAQEPSAVLALLKVLLTVPPR